MSDLKILAEFVQENKSIIWLRFVSVLLGVFLCSASFSQEYNYDNWQAKDGLAQNSVKMIAKDKKGYLWMSTEGGLSRFDGVSFTNFGLGSNPLFKSSRIGYLTTCNYGEDILFWSYLRGLVAYSNNTFIDVSHKELKVSNRIVNIFQIAADSLLVKYYGGEFGIIDSRKFEYINEAPIKISNHLFNIFNHKDYNIWVYRSKIQIRNSNFNLCSQQLDAHFSSPINSAAYDSTNNSLWISCENEIRKYKDLKLERTYPIPPEISNFGKASLMYRNNKIHVYVTTKIKVFILNESNGEFDLLTQAENICPDGGLLCADIDEEENVWIGSATCGLFKLKPSRISYLDNANWDTSQNIYPIIKDSIGNHHLGSRLSGIIQVDSLGNKVEDPVLDFMGKRMINSISFHKGAQYFSAYKDNYIWKRKGNELSKIYFPDSILSQKNAIYSTPSGRLVLGYDSGYYEIINNEIIAHPIFDNPEMGFISNFYESQDGLLWIASDARLLAIDQRKDSIVYDSRIEHPDILVYREINEHADGTFFIGTYGYGFVIIENGKLFNINKTHGLIDGTVSTITEDTHGHIWLTGNKGLTRLKKSEVTDLVHGKRTKLSVVLYNESTDRLRTSEFNGGQQQSKIKLGENRYVFPSMKGAVIVDFDKMQDVKNPPFILIETIVYNDSTYYNTKELSTDYTAGRLDIKYTSTSCISPRQIEFTYKLEGFDTDWIEAGFDRKASYGKLPPGDYTFLVKAKSHEGLWNENPAKYSFRIIPPFYMTDWFNFLIIALAIIFTAMIVSAFNKQKRQQSAKRQLLRLEAIVNTEEKERKRIATDLHDGVGQLLSSIKINLGLAREKFVKAETSAGITMVEKSKEAIEEVMGEIRNISYNLLPPSLEQFGLGIAISEEVSKLQDNPKLHVHFDHSTNDDKFDPKIEIVLFRVFQELLNNTIKHAEATEITVQLIQHDKALLLMIEDDGKGYNLNKALAKKDSSGLKNIHSRVHSIKGKVSIESYPGKGSIAAIEIPIEDERQND